jgi:hypothetical protein
LQLKPISDSGKHTEKRNVKIKELFGILMAGMTFNNIFKKLNVFIK